MEVVDGDAPTDPDGVPEAVGLGGAAFVMAVVFVVVMGL